MNQTKLCCVYLVELSVELILGFYTSLRFLVAVPNSDIISHVSRRQKLDVFKKWRLLTFRKASEWFMPQCFWVANWDFCLAAQLCWCPQSEFRSLDQAENLKSSRKDQSKAQLCRAAKGMEARPTKTKDYLLKRQLTWVHIKKILQIRIMIWR